MLSKGRAHRRTKQIVKQLSNDPKTHFKKEDIFFIKNNVLQTSLYSMIEIIENKIYLKTKSISTELSMQVKKVKVYSKLVTVRYIATPLP